jgi:GrxC family glutaredoxin
MKTVTMYTKTQCSYCLRAKALLKSLGVTPIEHNIETDPSKQAEMERRVPAGVRTVPQIFIGGERIGGYDKLSELHQRGELKKLLDIP